MISRPLFVLVLMCCAGAVFAGAEYQYSERTQTTQRSYGEPPYPADLESRYQSYRSSAGAATSYWQAPQAIPFQPCGRWAPNVNDTFGFGPHVNGYEFRPGGRLEPITPAMMGVGLLYFGLPPYPMPRGPIVPGFW
jgi:hypothetical protein